MKFTTICLTWKTMMQKQIKMKMLCYHHQRLAVDLFTRKTYVKSALQAIKNLNRSKQVKKISNFGKFIDWAQRWKQCDHEYSKVYDAIDLTNSSNKYAHKAYKGKILKESYLTSQKTLETSCEIRQQNELGTDIQNEVT